MQKNSVGQFIREIREGKNLSQKDISQGLCSVQKLSSIEMGERIPDVFLFEYILQRLGVSPDDFEMVLFEKEFREIEFRDVIEEKIAEENWEEAEELLEKAYQTVNDGIDGQYYWQMKAIIASMKNQHETSIDYIREALKNTHIVCVKEKNRQVLLSTREIELFCMMADEYLILKQNSNAEKLTKDLMEYLEQVDIQDMEFVKTYPKVVYLNTRFVDSQCKNVKIIENCERAFELLINCDSTVFLPEIMKILIDAYQEMGLINKATRLEKQLESLEQLFREYDLQLYVSDDCRKWFRESYRKEYLLCEELLKGERIARGLKCKELIEGIYEDPETLIRIESGSQSPSYRKYQLLMKRLHMNTEKYSGVFVCQNDSINKCKDKITDFYIKHNYEDAKMELEKLKLLAVDKDIVCEQYIAKENAFLDYELAQIDENEFLGRMTEALTLTYKGNWKECLRIPTLAEAHIFNCLFAAYRKKGLNEECHNLFKKVFECYWKSKVRDRYHYRALALLYRQYLLLLEELGYCDEGIAWSEREMRYEISAGRGQGLDYICTEIACIHEKSKNLEEDVKRRNIEKYLRFAFYLSDLFQRQSNNKVIDKYYRETIDRNIKWY